jgi:hypothetical protein
VRRASRRARVAALLLVAATEAGCEYFRDSPEQELANRRWRECTSGLRDVQLQRVDVDGRIRFTYVAINERDAALACLAAAARSERALPEPVASAVAGK